MSKSGNLAALGAILNSSDPPTVYYAEDPPYLPRILIFYWPVQAVGSLASTSRIRTTILSAAGFKSFGAFQVSPSSAYYSAVHKLPEDKQRDDVYRGIAFSLCRYFSEIPVEVKNAITDECPQLGAALKWGQGHAAHITCRLSKVTNVEDIVESLKPFSKELKARPPSPIAPVKPLSSIRKTRPSILPQEMPQHTPSRFGQFMTPSKRIPSGSRRTPSYSTPGGTKSTPAQKKHNMEQLESLRFKMCEFVDTEDRYASRLQELIELVETQSRTAKSLSAKSSSRGEKVVNAMLQFPALLDQIRELNLSFLDDVEASLQASEEPAMAFLESSQPETALKDPIGAYSFAKVLLTHFPKFPVPYREYLDLHSQISSNLDQFLKETNPASIQQAPSLLMEPAQRISRYGLYIDTMIPHLPSTATVAARTFEKARKIIAEICEMEPAASTILDGLRIEHESRRRPLSPTKLLSSLTGRTPSVREAPSLTNRETPRLLPSLSRSFSRKTRRRPGLPLSEQDIDQVSNITNENSRPNSNGSGSEFGSIRGKRPGTAGSARSLFGMKSSPDIGAVADADQYKQKIAKLEDDNYKLLQENAELKRRLRECACGK
jgi:RhoGEF domain